MATTISLYSALRKVFWFSFCFTVFECIAITNEYLFCRIPVVVPKSMRSSYGQPLPENKSTKSFTTQRAPSVTRFRENMTTHVAFLKVHKAGSTTMQNLFFRFGLKHNLNILLPKTRNYLHSADQKMPLKNGEHYDIFACHTVYEKEWFDSLLPTDSVKIGIVREPVSRIISSACYYRDVFHVGYLKKIPRENFVHNLINYPSYYDPGFFSHTRNTMGKDFGFKSGIRRTQVKRYLDKLNSQFLLVLIMERFDESLVMMRRLLNWSLSDIIYLKTNSYKHNHIVLNDTEIAKLKSTSFLDFEIYEYFSEVFEMKLKQVEDDFHDEVAFFKSVINHVHAFCWQKNKTDDVALSIQQTQWNENFQIVKLDCKWMKTKELPFIRQIRSQYRHSSKYLTSSASAFQGP